MASVTVSFTVETPFANEDVAQTFADALMKAVSDSGDFEHLLDGQLIGVTIEGVNAFRPIPVRKTAFRVKS